jgi:hypothetical protein
MPLNENLNTKLSLADETAIDNALDSVTGILNNTIVDPLNLSDSERSGTRGVSDIRYPYVTRAVSEFGFSYPALNSIDVAHTKAINNYDFFNQLNHVETKALALLDLVTDIKINCGYTLMKFTDDQYDNARRNRTRNVPGADIVYDAQFPLYDREANPEVPAGGGGNP